MPLTREPVLLRPRVEEFLTFCRARNLSPNTIRAYGNDLAAFAAFAGSEAIVSQINRKVIRAFIVHLSQHGVSTTSVNRKLACVKSFCRWLENEDLLDAALIQSFPGGPLRRDQLPDVPSEADLKILLDGDVPTESPERDGLILELLYGAGLRASEVVGINVSDFQEKDVLLARGKGKKERLVLVGEYAQRALGRWLPIREKLLAKWKLQTDALFVSVGPRRSIDRLSVRSVGRIVKAIAKAKSLPEYHPHALRHACGTHMHDHNAPLQAVAIFLGHVRLSTAQIYTRVSTGRMMDVYRKAHPHAKQEMSNAERTAMVRRFRRVERNAISSGRSFRRNPKPKFT